MTDWYDELKRRDRKAHEKLGLPEFDTAPIGAGDTAAPVDAPSRYLQAMGIAMTGRLDGRQRWACGCVTLPAREGAIESVAHTCARHKGKVS